MILWNLISIALLAMAIGEITGLIGYRITWRKLVDRPTWTGGCFLFHIVSLALYFIK